MIINFLGREHVSRTPADPASPFGNLRPNPELESECPTLELPFSDPEARGFVEVDGVDPYFWRRTHRVLGRSNTRSPVFLAESLGAGPKFVLSGSRRRKDTL